jgi:hypothetical protein
VTAKASGLIQTGFFKSWSKRKISVDGRLALMLLYAADKVRFSANSHPQLSSDSFEMKLTLFIPSLVYEQTEHKGDFIVLHNVELIMPDPSNDMRQNQFELKLPKNSMRVQINDERKYKVMTSVLQETLAKIRNGPAPGKMPPVTKSADNLSKGATLAHQNSSAILMQTMREDVA